MAIERERRSQARIVPPRPVYVDYPTQRPCVRNISLGGAYIEDPNPLPRGRMVQMRFWLDEKSSVEAKVMVRRCDTGVGMGVEFLAMSEADRRLLRSFVGATPRVDRL